jgi:hypothetical protein
MRAMSLMDKLKEKQADSNVNNGTNSSPNLGSPQPEGNNNNTQNTDNGTAAIDRGPLVTGSGDKSGVAPLKNLPGAQPATTEYLNTQQRRGLIEPPKAGEFIYSTPNSEQFSIHLSSGEVRAQRGVLRVNSDQHREIQDLIKSGRPDIAQNALLLDMDAAEHIAREHLEAEKLRNRTGRGATSTSMSAERMQHVEGHTIPDRLSQLDVVEEGATHGDDGNFNPDGSPVTRINPITGQPE